MDFVEGLRPILGQPHHLGVDDVEAFSLEMGDDLADMAGGDGVRLDDGEGAHCSLDPGRLEEGNHVGGSLHHTDAGLFERLHLFRGRTGRA